MKTVLLVDDDDFIREHLSRFLRRGDIKVLTAARGAEALELFSKEKPACVLLDIKLPDTDGIALFRRIKSLDSSARVYFMSGSTESLSDEEAKAMGAAGFLPKPVDISELQNIIKTL